MTCASCVAHVGRALRRVPGVDDATVNLATEHAVVAHAPAASVGDLIAAIERAGYGATAVVDAAAADADDAARRARELRRKGALVAFGLALATPAMLLSMLAPPFAGKDAWLFALAVPVWAIVGFDFHRSALARLRSGGANMDTLVSLGSTAALAYSVDASLTGGEPTYETAAAIVALIALGKYLEIRARSRSSSALRGLLDLAPETARLRATDGTLSVVAVASLRVGDAVDVAAGERVPIDGVVVAGTGALDVSAITGEPLPRIVEPGDDVRAASLALDATLSVRATAVGAGTSLARIVRIVRDAQGSTPPVQRLADRVASIFVPTIVAIAAVTFVGWLLTGHAWPAALVAAIAVLVVACPCALGLATPMAVIVGVGVAAKHGVLVRDATALEALARVDEVAFDKTGTLTVGRFDVTTVRALDGSDARVLRVAAALERASAHPLAAAIVRAAEAAGVVVPDATRVRASAGGGLAGEVDGLSCLAGSRAFLTAAGVAGLAAAAADLPPDATVVFVAEAGRSLGVIALADVVRPASARAVDALRRLGIAARVVSGDREGSVAALARDLGIDAWAANATPENKAALVRSRREAGVRVAFVGDGINDAPALASANVGIAMGSGSEVALEAAGAALLENDPRAVATAVAIARATMRAIAVNLFWAFAYNVVLVPLAVMGIVRPVTAAAAMGLSSLFVVGNSLLLRQRRF